MDEQLYVELYHATKLFELLDMKIGQVETRDSFSNIRTETNVNISKKTDREDLDTTKVMVDKREEGEKVVNGEMNEERFGIIDSWVWIVGL